MLSIEKVLPLISCLKYNATQVSSITHLLYLLKGRAIIFVTKKPKMCLRLFCFCTGYSKDDCFKRAQDYWEQCGSNKSYPVTTQFRPEGKSKTVP